MSIVNFNQYMAAAKQNIPYTKTQTATTVAAQWHTLFDRAGAPGAGSLAIGNTTTGVVPTDATTGCPTIDAFGGGAVGYLTRVEFSCTVAGRLYLLDRLWHAGSVAANAAATTTITTPPSYSSRVVAADYKGLGIFAEINTAIPNNTCTIYVTYTNSAGTTGRTSGTISIQNFVTGRVAQLPLQAGDAGVQAIESIVVASTAAASGSFNIIVGRPLWKGRVRSANDGDVHDLGRTGMVRLFDDSALWVVTAPDSTSSGVPDLVLEIANA